MAVCNALIHEFVPSEMPYFDEEGDQMLGYYYQFIDEADEPVGQLIGPYGYEELAERAASRAFRSKDF